MNTLILDHTSKQIKILSYSLLCNLNPRKLPRDCNKIKTQIHCSMYS